MKPNDTPPPTDDPEVNNAAGAGCMARLVVPLLAWPDRCAFWIVEHHWGMELVESFLHGDEDEDESLYAIRGHHGGDTGNAGPFMPRDLESDIAAKAPRFLFVSDGNPFILHNVEHVRPLPARAEDAYKVEVVVKEKHRKKAAGRGCHVAACS